MGHSLGAKMPAAFLTGIWCGNIFFVIQHAEGERLAMEVKIEETPRGMAARIALNLRQGLHARPAARLAQLAQTYSADILIVTETGEVDAKSMLDILSLAPQGNAELLLLAHGVDAREALHGLSHFLLNLQD